MIILRIKDKLFARYRQTRPRPKPEFKEIKDLGEYTKNNGINFGKASKFQRINARLANEGEQIRTIASDGVTETNNTAKKGSYIVNNVSNPDNKWIIEGETFNKKYSPVSDKPGVFAPKGGPMNAGKLKESVSFKAPWGEKMNIRKGGYILQDPNNPKDMYGISKEDFRNTYKFDNKPNQNTTFKNKLRQLAKRRSKK